MRRFTITIAVLLVSLAACSEGRSGGTRGEDTPCTDQSDCAPFHLVCVAPPGIEEGEAVTGLCVKGIPAGSCAFYVREGHAAGKFCVD